MTRKMAVIAVEFDDPEGNFEDASDLATYVSTLDGLKNLNVLVYSSPAALVVDSAEGFGIFAEGREDGATPINSAAEEAYVQSQP